MHLIWPLDKVLFLCFSADVAYYFFPNSKLDSAVSSSIFLFLVMILDLYQIWCKYVLNRTNKMHNLQHSRKLVLIVIRCPKGAGIKIHKCLVLLSVLLLENRNADSDWLIQVSWSCLSNLNTREPLVDWSIYIWSTYIWSDLNK